MPSTSSPSLITPRQATAEVVYWPGRACDRGLRSWEGSALKPKIAIFFVIEPIRTLKQSFLLCCHPCHSFQRQRPRSRTAPPSRTLFRRRSRVVLFLQSGQSSRLVMKALVNVSSVLHQSATILSNPQHCLRSLSLAWSSPPSVGLSGATLSKCSDC